jgi:branched-chain amino acid transport system ATP-binding protein
MTELLATSALVKQFRGNRALGPVNFRAAAGEIVGLIGPNGSGKTTFFNVVTGFLKPTAGMVRWQGDDIAALAPGRRAQLGLVRTFQEKMVFSGLSVRENLRYAIRASLDYVGLPERTISQQADDLSWGQCRLLGMAMALMLRPKLLLLDEPFAGLNRIAAGQVTSMLQRLKGDGIGAVIVEHEMSLLLPLCDRVVVFAAGEILSEGPSDEILKRADVRSAYFGAEVVAGD